MSYDLYFFKRKESKLSEKDIENYLTTNLVAEENGQWIFQNDDTEVYYIFEKSETEIDEDEIEFIENYENFDNLNFTFILITCNNIPKIKEKPGMKHDYFRAIHTSQAHGIGFLSRH